MRIPIAVLALALLGCPNRHPSEPGVGKIGDRLYRGTLDGRAGILLFEASDTALTLAYDPRLGGLWKAWKGSARAGGPMYAVQEAATLWTLRRPGEVHYLAASLVGTETDSTGFLALHWALGLPDGSTARVTEEPSWDNHYGDHSLQRDFRFEGIPEGDTLSLRLGAAPGRWNEIWSQSADGEMAGTGPERRLDMAFDGVANVKVLWEGSARP